MPYVDGYVLPVPKDRIEDYRRLAEQTGRIWREHGALEYRECVCEDFNAPVGIPLFKQIDAKDGETVVLAWIVFESRAHRDEVNAKAMKDPRITGMDTSNMPFDCRRMAYGGFEVLVAA
jgi:uncharacterized protein YbaA (DUF1428 family)